MMRCPSPGGAGAGRGARGGAASTSARAASLAPAGLPPRPRARPGAPRAGRGASAEGTTPRAGRGPGAARAVAVPRTDRGGPASPPLVPENSEILASVRPARGLAELHAAAALRVGIFHKYPLDERGQLYLGPEADVARRAWFERQVEIEANKIQALGPACKCLITVAKVETWNGLGPEVAGEEGQAPRSLCYDKLPHAALSGLAPWLQGRIDPEHIVVGTLNWLVDHPDKPVNTRSAHLSDQLLDSYGALETPMERGLEMSYIFNVCVARAYRRFGVCTSMLEQAHEGSARAGARSAFMHCDKANAGALSLYNRLGYAKFEEESRKWWYISGSTRRTLLERPLD